MKKRPLSHYVIGVVISLVLVNCIAWFIDGEAVSQTAKLLSLGFLLGMLAMYIAVHLYEWK